MNVDHFKMRMEDYMKTVWGEYMGKRGTRGCDPANYADAGKLDDSAMSKAALVYAIGIDVKNSFPVDHGMDDEIARIETAILSASELEEMENAFNRLLVMKKRVAA